MMTLLYCYRKNKINLKIMKHEHVRSEIDRAIIKYHVKGRIAIDCCGKSFPLGKTCRLPTPVAG